MFVNCHWIIDVACQNLRVFVIHCKLRQTHELETELHSFCTKYFWFMCFLMLVIPDWFIQALIALIILAMKEFVDLLWFIKPLIHRRNSVKVVVFGISSVQCMLDIFLRTYWKLTGMYHGLY